MKKKLGVAVVMIALFGIGQVATSAPKESRFEKLELFNKVLYLIESQYYRKVDVEKLMEGALQGMMETLDPHSAYLNKDVFAKMQEDTQGEFGGLGIEVTQKEGVIIVITPIDDTPAFKAGIRSGDKIVEIDHESTNGITLEQAVDKMRGKSGSKIHIGVIREGSDKVIHYNLAREIIQIKPVKFELIDEKYAFVRLTQFQKRSAKSIASALKKMNRSAKGKAIEGIVLDLRSNPGGLLDEAVNVASLFMKDGVVVSTEGRDPKNKEIRYVVKTGAKYLDIPMVTLINGASASASEIVAGALQDAKRSIIMGTQSFGKGSVQTIAKIDDERGVKLTIAQYMTPNGRKIQARGISPDVELQQLDNAWLAEHEATESYIREKDLRNHLTATIETPEEKKNRLAEEKAERLARIKMLEERKKKKKNDLPKKYKASEDFQVVQAVNYLKSYKVFKKLK